MNGVTIKRVETSVTIRRAPAGQLTVRPANAQLTVTRAVRSTLSIQRSGRPGAQGPPGQDGAALDYEFLQPIPASTWTVNHNLGVRPNVRLLTPGGVEFDAQVIHTSDNQLLVVNNTSVAGSARCI